ncbi:MAG: threonine-phosphate decarboxylase, partial [Kineosporiaceae bacterium]|nr:threonine-phosphate decarboxylase [Aeromicrobium sp.]
TVDSAPMIGALDADAVMTPKLTLSYRQAVAPQETLLSPAGGRITGHEFHRTSVTPAYGSQAAWLVEGNPVGFSTPTLHASYLHTHWAGHPAVAQRFANAVHVATPPDSSTQTRAPKPRDLDFEARKLAPQSAGLSKGAPQPAAGLRHHGDAEASLGLVDFAVNVYDGERPDWLSKALASSLDTVHLYPEARTAEAAVAKRHGRAANEVLATAGAAEAFGLIARMRDWKRPVVVHPQFTEPDVALVAAGHSVEHVILDEGTGFQLDPDAVPTDADVVFVGNPTNPTSVLHSTDTLRALAKPGRILVVDEAFMDSVPAEKYSVAAARLPGLIVIRSLTKLWAIPGVRAGYALAESALVTELRDQQTPWSVSTTAAAAMVACSSDGAIAEASSRAATIARHRAILVDGLTALGFKPIGPASAPFVLVKVGAGVHQSLREAGYAARRADTFPGLGPEWIRIAVRRPDVTRKLLTTLAALS